MKSVLDKYGEQIRENKPINYNGIVFNPLTVRDMTMYLSAKLSFELMLSSLSPALARLSWIEALYELDKIGEQKTDFFRSVLNVIAIAANVQTYNNGQTFDLSVMGTPDGKLSSFILGQKTTNDPKVITVQQMSEVREIIATQNGYVIPDESWNPDLVRAQQYTAGQSDIKLKTDFDSLVAAVSVQTHSRMAEIYDWPIREFFLQRKAIDRSLRFTIYGLAEAMGSRFKDGNPVPMWEYEREMDLPDKFKTLAELDNGAKGILAVPKDKNGYV